MPQLIVQNPMPMNGNMMMTKPQGIIPQKSKPPMSNNLANIGGEGNSAAPPTLMIQMSNLKKMLASTGQATKMMDPVGK